MSIEGTFDAGVGGHMGTFDRCSNTIKSIKSIKSINLCQCQGMLGFLMSVTAVESVDKPRLRCQPGRYMSV